MLGEPRCRCLRARVTDRHLARAYHGGNRCLVARPAHPLVQPELTENGRRMEDAVERGERIVHVTGERQLLAADRPARYRGALEDGNAPPGACQHRGGDQSVGPRADDDGVGVRDRGRAHDPISMPSAPTS